MEKFLRQDTGAGVLKLLDGLIVYEAQKTPDEIRQLKYFNNSYKKLAVLNCRNFDEFVRKVTGYLRSNGKQVWDELRHISRSKLTYRIMLYDRNHPAHVEKQLLTAMEKWISNRELVDRTSPEVEISGFYRSEGIGYLGLKLNKHPESKEIFHAGELRPEVAEILVRLADLTDDEIILDAFAGYGAIAAAAQGRGKFRQMWSMDTDPEKIRLLRKRFGKDKRIIIRQSDATNLTDLEKGTVDKIITDPPWGNFDRGINISRLYPGMMKEFVRVLADGGKMVILTAARDVLEGAAAPTGQLEIEMRRDVLISGRKASIYLVK